MKNVAIKFALMLLSPSASFAYSVSPMTAEFKIESNELSQVYTVTNTDSQPLAIEVRIEERSHDPGGKEISKSTEDIKKLFSIFPKAALIQPKQKKGIRVIYLGPKNLLKEKAYRVIISQQPSRDATEKAGVKMLQEFKTAAYVVPKNAKPDVKLKNVELIGKAIKLTFENQGSAHKLVKTMSVLVSDELGNEVTFDQGKENQFLVNFLSGEERYLIVEKPERLKGKTLKARLKSIE